MTANQAGGYLEIRGLTVEFETSGQRLRVLDHLDLSAEPGEIVAVVGPSGCGKSTLVHVVAGFVIPTAGEVSVDRIAVSGPSPSRGIVLQELGLFRWKTVRQNVEFGLHLQGIPEREYRDTVDGLLQRIRLGTFADYYPDQLSGGMAQRAALARALAPNPKVLLLDEPFGALDAQTRLEMQSLLLDMQAQRGVTVLLVTHDVEEALFLADRVLLLSARPASVVRQFRPGIPRPRSYVTVTDPLLVTARREVLGGLREEVLMADAQIRTDEIRSVRPTPLRVGIVAAADAMPAYVALHRARRQTGSPALEFFHHESGPALLRATLGRYLDVAVVGACPTLAILHEGQPVRILRDGGHLVRGKHAAGVVVSSALCDAPLSAVANSAIGINGFGTNSEFLCRAAFAGMDGKLRFDVMPVDQIVGEIKAGRLSAAALFPPHLGRALAIPGVTMKVDFLEIASPLQSSLLVTAPHPNMQSPPLLRDFLWEWDDAVQALSNCKESPGTQMPVEIDMALQELGFGREVLADLPSWSEQLSTASLQELDAVVCRTRIGWKALAPESFMVTTDP